MAAKAPPSWPESHSQWPTTRTSDPGTWFGHVGCLYAGTHRGRDSHHSVRRSWGWNDRIASTACDENEDRARMKAMDGSSKPRANPRQRKCRSAEAAEATSSFSFPNVSQHGHDAEDTLRRYRRLVACLGRSSDFPTTGRMPDVRMHLSSRPVRVPIIIIIILLLLLLLLIIIIIKLIIVQGLISSPVNSSTSAWKSMPQSMVVKRMGASQIQISPSPWPRLENALKRHLPSST